MKHLLVLALAVLAAQATAFAQEALEIRDVEIDSQSPEGSVLTQAGIAEEASERIAILEGFLNDFPESTYLGYVLLQLQTLYTQGQNWSKAAEHGGKLLAYVPEDLEVRHNHNQALLNSQNWPELIESLRLTKPLADKDASAPPPEDPTEDEEMIYESSVDYAKGVVQYTEWATNVGVTQSAPAQQIQFMDLLKELYPDSQYLEGIDAKYILAYQQQGDVNGMVMALERAIANDPGNYEYIFTLAEIALGQQNYEVAIARSEELVKFMEENPAPEGIAEEAWEATKTRFTALGQFLIGSAHFRQGGNNNAWRTSRRHLLQSVDVVKAEGGERYGLLSWMLGFCYVKLDIAGDNIRQATHWMSEAAKTPGPMQAQAAQTLEAIRKAAEE